MSTPQLLIPAGLLALLALPVIVLLHMRNTIPPPRPVPALRFWHLAAREQTDTTRFRRPPLTVLLLLHLLIAALLAIGLARPAVTGAWAGLVAPAEARHVIVLLDGSTSMGMTGGNIDAGERRYALARRAALAELDGLRQGDVATVLVLGTRTVTMGATDQAALARLRERLGETPAPGGRADLTGALVLARDLLLPGQRDEVVLITDGAVTADPGVVADLGAPVRLVLIGDPAAPPANVAVTGLSSRTAPGDATRSDLYARLGNFGTESVRTQVLVRTDGFEVRRDEVTLPPGGEPVELTWRLAPGVREVGVEVLTSDALPEDDRAALVLFQDSSLALEILLVSDLPGALQRALEVLPGARVTTVTSDEGEARAGGGFDLVVFERVAPPAVLPDAALLFVQPPPGSPFPTRGEMAAPGVTGVAADDPLLRGVDLAGLTFGPIPVYELASGQPPVVSAEAGPILFRSELEGRPAVTIGFDIEQSNIRQRVAFPILIANVVAELVPSGLPAAVPLGDPLVYQPGADTAGVSIDPPVGDPVTLPVPAADPRGTGAVAIAREVAFTDTGQPGSYAVAERGADGTILGGGRFVVNAGHPAESDPRPRPGLAETLATASGGDADPGRAGLNDLWPLFALAALAALSLEWLVTVFTRDGIVLSRGRGLRSLRPGRAGTVRS